MSQVAYSDKGRLATVTCECGFEGSMAAWECHSCYVQEMGGRCEDYPCCGHTDGDGCQTRPEHTSEFWYNQYERADRMGYDLDDYGY